MKIILKLRTLGTCLSLLLIWFPMDAGQIQPQLPDDVAINKDAGRGNLLFVTLRLESGEELLFFVDTGASFSGFDKSLEPKLGEPLGTVTMMHWGEKIKTHVYTTPKLYLESTPLLMASNVVTSNFKLLSFISGRPVKGILGMDCLRNYCIQLDFQAGKMRFLESNHLNVAELGKSYPITFEGNRPFIHQASFTGGTSTNSLIDTGMFYDGQVENVTIKGHFLIRFRNFFVTKIPLVRKFHRHLLLPECVWDGKTYTKLKVDQGKNANVLGLRFMARHLVTFDFPNGMMYLKQTSVGPFAGKPQKN